MPGIPPKNFVDLEPWVDTWCLRTERERNNRRISSDIAELQKFYDAMLPRMDEILSFLSQFDLDSPRAEIERLFLLSLAMAEVAPAVEFYHSATVPDTFGAERFRFGHDAVSGLYPPAARDSRHRG